MPDHAVVTLSDFPARPCCEGHRRPLPVRLPVKLLCRAMLRRSPQAASCHTSLPSHAVAVTSAYFLSDIRSDFPSRPNCGGHCRPLSGFPPGHSVAVTAGHFLSGFPSRPRTRGSHTDCPACTFPLQPPPVPRAPPPAPSSVTPDLRPLPPVLVPLHVKGTGRRSNGVPSFGSQARFPRGQLHAGPPTG